MKLRELLAESGNKVFFTVSDMHDFTNAFDKKHGEGATDEISFYGNSDMGFPKGMKKDIVAVLKKEKIKFSENK